MREKVERKNSGNSRDSSKKQYLEYELPENISSLLFDSCFVDPSGRQFACIHENCHQQISCFKSSLFQEKIDFHELQFLPEDRILWCTQAVPDIIRFIDSEPVVELPDYRFIFNHRYIRKDGSISQFMHEGSLIFADRFPVLKLKVFFEIGDLIPDETITLKIFRYSADEGYLKVFRKVYGGMSNSLLSQREIEIIRLCHEGLSSKMIAEKLNLSIHTVKNHKRNIMEKTFTHNITELIHLCIKSHWL